LTGMPRTSWLRTSPEQPGNEPARKVRLAATAVRRPMQASWPVRSRSATASRARSRDEGSFCTAIAIRLLATGRAPIWLSRGKRGRRGLAAGRAFARCRSPGPWWLPAAGGGRQLSCGGAGTWSSPLPGPSRAPSWVRAASDRGVLAGDVSTANGVAFQAALWRQAAPALGLPGSVLAGSCGACPARAEGRPLP